MRKRPQQCSRFIEMKMHAALFVLAALLSFALGAKLPADFKICKRSDLRPSSDCFKTAVQDALPKLAQGIAGGDLKVNKLKPLLIPSATIGEGKGAVNVVQKYKNFKVHGLVDSIVDFAEATLNPKDFKIVVQVHGAEYRFESDYDFSGRVLLLPIVGAGPCNITGKNVKIDVVITGEIIEKKGKEYMKAKDCTVKLTPEKVIYKFDNLFNGDVALGNQINTVLNDNWKEVFNDVEEGYALMMGQVYVGYINDIFSKVPLSDISPE